LGAAIALVLVVAGPASAWPQSDWGRVVSTLKRIHTVAGANAFQRMTACHLRFDRRLSWVEDAQLAPPQRTPQIKGKPGDLFLQVTFEAPKAPGRKTPVKDIIAQWYIPKSDAPTPWGRWADELQNSDRVEWLPC
jgi:hypothetical protein